MKGDFTRSTLRPNKHYCSVRMQQGRVQLDADANEQADLAAHRLETATLDVVGGSGGPGGAAGFALALLPSALPAEQQEAARQLSPLKSGDFFISAGRFYVDGILCENEGPVTLGRQADLPGLDLPADQGIYLAYLDVWQRHITALEDPDILEVALGGPDTSTRVKTVWQVKWTKVTEAEPACGSEIEAWALDIAPGTGTLTARARPTAARTGDDCMLEPGAGYKGLENQLYRVEIHEGGELGTATFKWSRDNGSIVTAWLGQSGNQLTVRSSGRDAVLGFAPGDCVELTDDTLELSGEAGPLVKVVAVEGETVTIDPGAASVEFAHFPSRPKMRRWDMGASGAVTLDSPSSNDGFIELENGVDVKFGPGSYKAGDYWLIPARTATGNVEWPFVEPQPAQGIAHHYCRLGLLSFDGTQYTALHDCRRLFPAVTELTSLFYLGGNGQLAAPGQTLPQSLQVGVANGQWPVPGATVRFAVTGGSGSLETEVTTLDVATDVDGVARCSWRLGVVTQNQQVEARLLDSLQRPIHLPVQFNASFSEDAHDPGVRIERLLLGDGSPLENDADVAFDRLAQGIDVICNATLAATTVGRATCFLTLDVPFPMTGTDTLFWGPSLLGYQPLVLAATAHSQDATMLWRPTPAVVDWLQDALFSRMSVLNRAPRLLARLCILGNFIWQSGKPDMFLDPELFGMRIASDGPPSVRARLPSGDGRRGGRLEMWFWVVPPITITISPETVRLQVNDRVALPVLFTVTVVGTADTRVAVTLSGVGIGSNGTISLTDVSQGIWTYRAPLSILTPLRIVTLEARSLADPTRAATATITLQDFRSGIDLGLEDLATGGDVPPKSTRGTKPKTRPNTSPARKPAGGRKQSKPSK